MNTQTRRQREYEQREKLFLDAARNIIRIDGISALTMDKIAEHTEYAKGTVYKHFTCKEDILCGLCLDSLGLMYEMFSHALTWQGNSREKIICIGVGYQLYTQRFPEEFDLLIAARTNNIRQKASPERLERMDQVDTLVLNAIRAVIQLAIQSGDLTLPEHTQVDDLCLGLWAMSFGLLVLEGARDLISGLELSATNTLLLNQMSCLLDGYHWHPLSTEHDYLLTYQNTFRHLEALIPKD
ncbi:MAG: TetR/AcrR family transcriptional regulator [Pseudomonadota bacterium]|nr:TetR/AcrR family transcriptional regulator [Pseudomonadota bacterium]